MTRKGPHGAQGSPWRPQGFQLTGIHGDGAEPQRTTGTVQQPVRLRMGVEPPRRGLDKTERGHDGPPPLIG